MVVALVGVAGTLSATALAQRASARSKQVEVAEQHRIRTEEREEAARVAALAEKKANYADLNSAARHYRTACIDYLLNGHGAGSAEYDRLGAARDKYRDVYARAQMIVPDAVLAVVSEVNRGLSDSYRALLEADADDPAAVVSLRAWFDGPMSDGVWLLRRTLREDLGVAEVSSDTEEWVDRLCQARIAQFSF